MVYAPKINRLVAIDPKMKTFDASPKGMNKDASHLGSFSKVNVSPTIIFSHHISDGLLSFPTCFLIFGQQCGQHKHLRSHYERVVTHPRVRVSVSTSSLSTSSCTTPSS